MDLLATLRARFRPLTVPPRCFACRQEEIPLEPVGQERWFCAVCGKDFEAVCVGEETWQVDVTPLRHKRRKAL